MWKDYLLSEYNKSIQFDTVTDEEKKQYVSEEEREGLRLGLKETHFSFNLILK